MHFVSQEVVRIQLTLVALGATGTDIMLYSWCMGSRWMHGCLTQGQHATFAWLDTCWTRNEEGQQATVADEKMRLCCAGKKKKIKKIPLTKPSVAFHSRALYSKSVDIKGIVQNSDLLSLPEVWFTLLCILNDKVLDCSLQLEKENYIN